MTAREAVERTVLGFARWTLVLAAFTGIGAIREAPRLDPRLWWLPTVFALAVAFTTAMVVLAAWVQWKDRP